MNVSSIHIDKILSLFPKWESKDLEFNKLNGLTNHTFKVTNIKYNNCLFLRIYTKLTPNINMNILQKCSDNGFGSKILLSYPEGRIESWIDGRVLVQEDLNDDIVKKIAKIKLKIPQNNWF